MNVVLIIEFLLYLTVLIYKYRKYNYIMLFYVTTWFIVYYLFYFIYGALCVDSFVITDKWLLSRDSINISKLIVCIEGLFYIFFYSLLDFKRNINSLAIFPRKRFIIIFSKVFLLLSFVILSFSLLKLITVFSSLISSFKYLEFRKSVELIRSSAHIKLISYVLLGTFYYCGLYKKKYRICFYFNFILIIIFEVFAGTRTTFFFIFIILYLLMVRISKRTHMRVLIVVAIFILFSSEIIRNIGLHTMKDDRNLIEKIFAGSGEFNNTFITIPYILNNHELLNKGEKIDLLGVLFNWIPPIARLFNIDNPGNVYQQHIGRGIGYASNFISNGLYFFGYFSLFLFPFLIILLKKLDEIFDIEQEDCFIIKLFMIVMVRNLCRESITAFNTVFYIIIIYLGWIIFFSRKNRGKICIN